MIGRTRYSRDIHTFLFPVRVHRIIRRIYRQLPSVHADRHRLPCSVVRVIHVCAVFPDVHSRFRSYCSRDLRSLQVIAVMIAVFLYFFQIVRDLPEVYPFRHVPVFRIVRSVRLFQHKPVVLLVPEDIPRTRRRDLLYRISRALRRSQRLAHGFALSVLRFVRRHDDIQILYQRRIRRLLRFIDQTRKRRDQHRRQYGDDRDHDHQFHDRKPFFVPFHLFSPFLFILCQFEKKKT